MYLLAVTEEEMGGGEQHLSADVPVGSDRGGDKGGGGDTCLLMYLLAVTEEDMGGGGGNNTCLLMYLLAVKQRRR